MLFKNAKLCDYRGQSENDIRVENGLIAEIGQLKPYKDEEVLDIKGKLLMPAMIDLNIAPKALSLSRKNLISLAPKALKGGVGTILLYPHTAPACSVNTSIELIRSIDTHLPITLIPACSPLNEDNRLSDIATLHHSGARAIFVRSDIDANLLFRIAQYAQMLDMPLVCLCQDSSLSFGVMNEGVLAARLGLPSIAPFNQHKEVAKIAEMLSQMPITVLFDALSFGRSIEIIQSYRATSRTKARFFTQVPIHHLILNENLCDCYNTAAKLNPPLVSPSQQEELLGFFDDIDIITSLQCADFNAKKDQVFELASFGIDALEYYFSLLFSFLHKERKIPLSAISQRTSYEPAQILKLNKGSLEVGKIAELIIINENFQFQIKDNFSPYHNATLQGRIEGLFNASQYHNPHPKDA